MVISHFDSFADISSICLAFAFNLENFNMEFKQSRFQDVFSRCYDTVCSAIWFFVLAAVAFVVFSYETSIVEYLTISLVFTLVSIGYLYYKHPEGSLRLWLNDDELVFQDSQTTARVPWPQVQEVKVSKTIPYRVTIKNSKYGPIRFSYYAFSAEQRSHIFRILNERIPRQEAA